MRKHARQSSSAIVLSLSHVSKRFGDFTAVNDVSFEIERSEFVSLLGPSGSGKTTILRLVAGLEAPTAGEILLNAVRIEDKPPFERDVTTVFQHYALFPHMDVFDNIAFGLRCQQRFSEEEIATRVRDALSLVRLQGYEHRTVRRLSGGEQQRIAVARAVVTEPLLLLLDEPLGALDLKLRRQMGAELTELQRRLGIAFLYVTHDQEEALSMSDRVILMHRGRTQQSGTPGDLFWRPRTRFVAEFIGEANVLSGSLIGIEHGHLNLDLGSGLTCLVAADRAVLDAGKVEFAVRGERIVLGPAAAGCVNSFSGTLVEARFYGSLTELVVALSSGLRLRARAAAGTAGDGYAVGACVTVGWSAEDAVILHD